MKENANSQSQANGGTAVLPPKKTVVYSCSGCSDAGELADRAARTLARRNVAEMSCLAGIGGRVKSLMAKAEKAPDILVIDGCPLNCARKTLELAGLKQFHHLELQRLGVRKGSTPVTEERIEMIVDAAAKLIAPPPAPLTGAPQESPDITEIENSLTPVNSVLTPAATFEAV